MREPEDPTYLISEELATGLLAHLRLRGVKNLVMDDKAQDCFVVAGQELEMAFNQYGIRYDFVLRSHPIYGGSGEVRSAFAAPSMQVILRRWLHTPGFELNFSTAMAEAMLDHLPGPSSLYEEFTKVWLKLAHS